MPDKIRRLSAASQAAAASEAKQTFPALSLRRSLSLSLSSLRFNSLPSRPPLPPELGFNGSRPRGLRRWGRIPGVRGLCRLHALLVRRRRGRRRLRVTGGRAGARAAAVGVGGGAGAQVVLRLLQRRHRRHRPLRPLPGSLDSICCAVVRRELSHFCKLFDEFAYLWYW